VVERNYNSLQNSLGQNFVKVFGRADSFNLEFESVPIYEDKEGFCVSSSIRKKVQFRGSALKEAEIVHSMAGRVRLRIPRLRQERSYAERLRQRLEFLADVQTVRTGSI
jgi:hypothetical protein